MPKWKSRLWLLLFFVVCFFCGSNRSSLKILCLFTSRDEHIKFDWTCNAFFFSWFLIDDRGTGRICRILIYCDSRFDFLTEFLLLVFQFKCSKIEYWKNKVGLFIGSYSHIVVCRSNLVFGKVRICLFVYGWRCMCDREWVRVAYIGWQGDSLMILWQNVSI